MVADRDFQRFNDGVFKPYFEKFILYKRSKGEKVAPPALVRMKYLNDTLNAYGTLEVTREVADEVLAPKPDVSNWTRYNRVIYLRQFLNFLGLLGVRCCRLPTHYARTPNCQFKPYIFSNAEITQLVAATDNVRKWNDSRKRTEIYPTLIRLLIGTGMRIGEVLALKRYDVDCENGIIKVINGKNGVCRYIPVSGTLNTALRNYMNTNFDNELLFPSPQTGRVYGRNTIASMFHKLCVSAGIYRADGTTPNIHSLRHTFCSKSLEQMLASGMDMYTAMPILAAYVGHVNYRDTERYIHFTENSSREFVEKEASLGRLIPEVKYNA
jgi:integrase